MYFSNYERYGHGDLKELSFDRSLAAANQSRDGRQKKFRNVEENDTQI